MTTFGIGIHKDWCCRILQYLCTRLFAGVRQSLLGIVDDELLAKGIDEALGTTTDDELIRISRGESDGIANLLDRRLQEVNSDYEAKRYKNITLQPLELIVARPGLFNDWLKLRGKLGGQNKVPRLSNERKHMDELLSLNA